jgi:RNA-directed DNA polymerase
MKESYGEGLAAHIGPESCAIARKGEGEALTGGKAGRVLSREIRWPGAQPRVLRGADAVRRSGRPHRTPRQREGRSDPARSETPCMPGRTAYGNREVPRLPASEGFGGRIGKSKDRRR